ncbi:DUF2273 domain-containing protein [Arabiibacter massiliensis]|uniref:DUF2273 domain-containing protein n=1 Tax=Arabiibacter massiliensis TaxID=1870985 RepID=UPI0009BA0CAE|nr:DUF2273 domain-containing protein [Arabiibacter massiliensis]
MTQSVMHRQTAAPSNPKAANPRAGAAKSGGDQRKNASASSRPAETPSDAFANAASETKNDRGVYASMKKAFAPYVENHSHAVLYGIVGFVAAALILLVGFWPTVLLALFAAIGVIIGKYRDGDRKTREQMKNVLDRFN